jgi:hypothetical protein
MIAVPLVLGCLASWAEASAQDEMPPDEPSATQPAPPAAPPAVPEKPAAPAAPGPGPAVPPGAEAPEPEAPPPGTMIDQPVAILQALDKITARIRRLTVKVGETASFGTLAVQVLSCRKAPPEEPPESAAFLVISDTKPGEAAKPVYKGWMFGSSPALAAMDHPVYDIWVVDCTTEPTASATPGQ